MQKLVFIFLVIVFGLKQVSFAQNGTTTFSCNYIEGNSADSLCKMMRDFSLTDNKDAYDILLKVLTPVGLRPNFVLEACDGIKNCIATIGDDGLRYIIYDKIFMKELADLSKTNWVSLSIFAHEVLHHLNQHTHIKANLAKRRDMELEADEWSGRICALLGATLAEAQAVMEVLHHPSDDTFSDHPTKEKRLDAIRKGFEAAQTTKPSPKLKLTLSDLSMANNELIKLNTLDSLSGFHRNKKLVKQVQFIAGEWYVFFAKDSGNSFQDYNTDVNFPFLKTMKMKSNNHQIKSIDYFNKQWLVVFEDLPESINQSLEQFKQFDENLADSLFKNATTIDDVAFGNAGWMVVTGKAADKKCIDQKVMVSTSFSYDQITQLQRDGYVIVMNKFIDGKWLSVLQKFDNSVPKIIQAKGRRTTFPFDDFIRYDNENYKIASAVYDGENWVYVLNKNKF